MLLSALFGERAKIHMHVNCATRRGHSQGQRRALFNIEIGTPRAAQKWQLALFLIAARILKFLSQQRAAPSGNRKTRTHVYSQLRLFKHV
jgi:hypothetical protein